MAGGKTYLVPVDFSKTSEIAVDEALRLRRENKGKLLLLHVISNSALMLPGPETATPQMYLEYERATRAEAQKQMQKLVRKKRLPAGDFQSVIMGPADPARVIANQAKKLRASMIIMGSRGRTGLKRLVLGSVAERTLRYAQCPVLIVKR